jgi:hypothetical protein
VGRHVAPLGHIILILSQPPTVFALTSYNNATCLAEKQQISIFFVFGLNPHSTTFETSTLTITPTMQFEKKERENTVHLNIREVKFFRISSRLTQDLIVFHNIQLSLILF